MNPKPIDPELFTRFLAGKSTDQELEQVEAALGDPSTVVDLNQHAFEDTLVWEVKKLVDQKDQLSIDDPDVSRLIERINAMVPCPSIGQEELDRVLSAPQTPDEIGRIGDYQIVEFIACGGMGLVFRARDKDLDRYVCIKIMHPSLLVNPDAKYRFEREAKASATLDHERIVTVFDVGEHRGLPFLVMRLLDGISLGKLLAQNGPLEESKAKKFALQIAEGLAYAHGLGYLHRDIKPDNIWITDTDDVKLLDFGLARAVHESIQLTNTGTVLGTPSYMSPEQVNGQAVDRRSDLFSLGTVFYEMLTGVSPFSKSNMFSTMMSVARDSLPLETLTESQRINAQLLPVLQKLLEKEPDARFQSATHFIDALHYGTLGDSAIPKLSSSEGRQKQNQGKESKLSSKSSGSGSRIRKFAIALGGAAALFAIGMFLYLQNDKGTLVIEVDPSVEVRFAEDSVYVVDPETKKVYDIKIGANPLPSGRYQLEFGHGSNEMTFSSETIIIRRGTKQIVKVTLRPPQFPDTKVVDVGEANTSSTDDVKKPSNFSSIDGNTIPSVPVFKLSDLPATRAETLAMLGFERDQPLTRFATVTKPERVDSITSWSIEPVASMNYDGSFYPLLSHDGKLIASQDQGGFVRIRNSDFKLTHVLPGMHEVKSLAWSPVAEVLAVAYEGYLAIWKISDDHAEIACQIKGNFKQIAWSQNGRQVVATSSTTSASNDFRDFRISMFQFSNGKVLVEPNHGIKGFISKSPLSADGRYLAVLTSNQLTAMEEFSRAKEHESIVQIWDLITGELHHEVRGAQFNTCSWVYGTSRLLVSGPEQIQIWDLATRELVNDSTPELLGTFDKTGRWSTRQIRGEQFELDAPLASEKIGIDLKPILRRIETDGVPATWSCNGQRILIPLHESTVIGDLSSGKFRVFDSPKTRLPNVTGIATSRIIEGQAKSNTPEHTYSNIRVSSISSGLKGDWTEVHNDELNADPKMVDFRKRNRVLFQTSGFQTSDDLREAIRFETRINEKGALSTNLYAFSTMAGDNRTKLNKEIELWGCIGQIQWSEETQSFIVSHMNFEKSDSDNLLPRLSKFGLVQIHAESKEVFNIKPFWPESENVSMVRPIGDQLIVVTQEPKENSVLEREQLYVYRAHRYNLRTQEHESTIISEAYSSNPLVGNKNFMLIPLRMERAQLKTRLFQIDFESGCQELELDESGPRFSSPKPTSGTALLEVVGVSSDGQFVAFSNSKQNSRSCRIYRRNNRLLKLAYSSETQSHPTDSRGSIGWHPHANVFAWEGKNEIEFIDPANIQSHKVSFSSPIPSSSEPLAATKEGWMLATFHGIKVLNLMGKPENTLFRTERKGGEQGFAAISASGALRDGFDHPNDVVAIYLKNNRFYTREIEQFEQETPLKLRQEFLSQITEQ